MANYYKETDKMFDVICQEPSLLQMMCRFGIPLGVGEKTVEETCREHGVDVQTFLAVASYLKAGPAAAAAAAGRVSVATLVAYLGRAHDYFLDFQLPALRRGLLGAIDCSGRDEVAWHIMRFFDQYMDEVRRHMTHENKRVFGYVQELLAGRRRADFSIAQFARGHESIDRKLQELKNIIIKYYAPAAGSHLLHSVLFDLFTVEADLHAHCEVEDVLFVPAVELLEQRIAAHEGADAAAGGAEGGREALSEREREVVVCIVRGLTNKEVAQQLFISVNTVLTHRKNIARKLGIHSVSGLTIYAIAQGLVRVDDVEAR